MIRFNYFSRVLISGAVVLTGILCACHHEKATVAAPPRVAVKVAGTSAANSDGRSFSGTVESADESTVSFSVPGTITKIFVDEGQRVSKGQILAKVKSESLQNASNIANAELEEARDAYHRLKRLHDADALPDIKWVEVQSKLKQAENAAKLANRAVSDATLTSPLSGYVSQKLADDGQTVIAAQPVLRIVDLDKLQVNISVPENEISAFTIGTTANITVAATDSIRSTGKLGQKGVVADPLTRTYNVKFDITNAGGRILPGMIAAVNVEGLSTDPATVTNTQMTLPSQAVLLAADNRLFVWVVKDGKAMQRFVTANELSADGVKILSGIAPGDSVIVAGMQKVSNGTQVTVAE